VSSAWHINVIPILEKQKPADSQQSCLEGTLEITFHSVSTTNLKMKKWSKELLGQPPFRMATRTQGPQPPDLSFGETTSLHAPVRQGTGNLFEAIIPNRVPDICHSKKEKITANLVLQILIGFICDSRIT
jgi:hypothetical protein